MTGISMRVYMYPAGEAGMALYSYKLANALAAKGLQITLFVDDQYELDNLPAKFSKVKVLSSRNVSIRSKQHRIARVINIIGAHFYNWYKFYCYVKKDRPEIVHTRPLLYLFDWWMLNYLKRINTKLVLTVHDVIPHKFYTRLFGWLELIILQYMYNKADNLIVHSEINKRQLLANFEVPEGKIAVIPHGEYSLAGMYPKISENEAHSKLNLPENHKVILFFGFIRKIKGIGILLKAFDKVTERFPDTLLVIAGLPIRGESFDEYHQIISSMKYGHRVRCFIRYIELSEIPIFFSSADIVVLPYLEFHSQSGVLHLAQGFGKPVIATDVGGLPQVVEDHTNGLIVPAGDVGRLAEAMHYLLKHEDLRLKMGQYAKQMAIRNFSWEAIAEATIERVYEAKLSI